MSTRAVFYTVCDRCGDELGSRREPHPHDVSQWSTGYYTSESKANRAAEAAGWRCQSESIGGDVCAACVERETWDTNANSVIDNADELAAYAEQAGHKGDE